MKAPTYLRSSFVPTRAEILSFHCRATTVRASIGVIWLPASFGCSAALQSNQIEPLSVDRAKRVAARHEIAGLARPSGADRISSGGQYSCAADLSIVSC